jgi:EAL domain-containing protein (putative c-di-GMP-specific phosphodiesterase class I)/GGDEF domain-containing protein
MRLPLLQWRGTVLLAAVAIAACMLSRELSFSGLRYSLIWPTGGLAFAALRLWGARGLATIVLSESAWLTATASPFHAALILAPLGTALGAWGANWLLNAWHKWHPSSLINDRELLSAPFDDGLSLSRFYVVQTVFAAPIAAVLGTVAFRSVSPELGSFANIALAYWIVQLIGILIYTPLLMLAARELARRLSSPEAAKANSTSALTPSPWIDLPGLLMLISVLALVLLLSASNASDLVDTAIFLIVPVLAYRAALVSPLAATTNLFFSTNAVLGVLAFLFSGVQTIAPMSPQRLVETVFVLLAATAVVQLLSAIALQRARAFNALERTALVDSLTGAWNDAGFRRHLDETDAAKQTCVFRAVLANLTVARGISDLVAIDHTQKLAAQQLRELFPDALLARSAPGRFELLMTDGADVNQAASAIHDGLRTLVWTTAGSPLLVTVLVTAVHSAPGKVRARDWLNALDIGESIARRKIGDSVHVSPFADCNVANLTQEQQRDAEIIDAIERGNLVLFAQSIASATPADASAPRAAVEMLSRLRRTDGSMMTPDAFLPVIKRHALTRRFDALVADQALDWLASLQAKGEAAPRYAAINVAAASVEDEQWAEALVQKMNARGVDPKRIVVELTESETILDTARAHAVLSSLRAHGVRVAIDDFGAGAASYSYLKNLPIDIVKIDGSFVRGAMQSAFDRSVISSVVALARDLNIDTVAEFVETPELRAFLAAQGVNYVQGYAIDKPQAI